MQATSYPDLLTVEDVIRRFPWFGKDFWARLRYRGNGPTFLRVGNRILYREQDVLDWLEGHRVSNTTEAKRQRVAA
jgi:hypothetical protein